MSGCLLLVCLFLPSPASTDSPAPLVTVGPIIGDRRIALLVAETVKTDLARSPHVALLESGGDPARFRIVGSCLEHRGRMVINLRIIDAHTRIAVPGMAANGAAAKDRFLPMVESLTERLGMKLANAFRPAPVRTARTQLIRLQGRDQRFARIPPALARTRLASPLTRSNHHEAVLDDAQPRGGLEQEPGRQGRPQPRTGDDSLVSSIASRYTGVILDAKGLGLERSMSPRIRCEGGETVWSGGEADPDFVIDEGIVVYARSVEEAKRLPRAGEHPLILKAVSRHPDAFHADPVLTREDSDLLLSADQKDGFLKRFHVVFVVD